MTEYYAIDFGTSNSLLAYVDSSGRQEIIKLEDSETLRSIIYTPNQASWYFGEEAIKQRADNDGEGRFFRSIKKFLAEPNFKSTEVHGRLMTIEQLVSKIIGHMKKTADKKLGKNIVNVVLGRPARYSASDANDQLAQDRMEKACKLAGFENIIFCPEPLAAGLNLAPNSQTQNVLIADFGGGTSDFTILRSHSGKYSREDVLGISGVFLAGDAFDGVIMKEFICKHFGSEIKYQIPFNDNLLTFPRKLMLILTSPAHIGLLREKETWELLKEIQNYSTSEEHKKKLDQLFNLVEYQLAYPIYKEIENTKINLSQNDEANFSFNEFGIEIEELIGSREYEKAVRDLVQKIKGSMLDSFKDAKIDVSQISKVYITGGTGQSPYIQKMLGDTFGKEKISKSEVYKSVIQGLAKYAHLQIEGALV